MKICFKPFVNLIIPVFIEKPPTCENDIMIGVDSSACYRDYHSRMNRFMKKLVRRIGRTDPIAYGGGRTRLALMQASFFRLQFTKYLINMLSLTKSVWNFLSQLILLFQKLKFLFYPQKLVYKENFFPF